MSLRFQAGPLGSEASAVAHTVARQFDNISRLALSYRRPPLFVLYLHTVE
jgi:hypothetical protein